MLFQQLIHALVSSTLLSTPSPEPVSKPPSWFGPGGATFDNGRDTIALRIRDLGEEVPRRVAEDALIVDLVASMERGNASLVLTINSGGDAPWKAPEWTAPVVEQLQATPAFALTITAAASYRF